MAGCPLVGRSVRLAPDKETRHLRAAAILSLALAISATTAVCRLVDAVLLRTLPVASPERLFYVAWNYIERDGHPDYRDDFDYPTFRQYRKVAERQADLMVVGMAAARHEISFGPGQETEMACRQYVSGNFFGALGLQPALGRLFGEADDVTPGAHPVAVLSYAYWARRFDHDPKVIGSAFRRGNDQFEIIGVAPKGFIGTEPGAATDVFIPAMMNAEAINRPGWSWFRIWVRPKDGVPAEQVRDQLHAVFIAEHLERVKNFQSDTPKQVLDAYLGEKLLLLPAGSGASNVQKEYRRPLMILAVLVALVLLVACANVGNLLTAQAAARAREMALRVSIGAGQQRLIQLVLVESAWLAVAASALGILFAWWATPAVVSMLRVPEDPVRLVLDTGWRELAFGVALASLVTLLFGLAPALRASAVKPMSALRGGEDPHSRRRLMNSMLAAQVAFCVLVLFVAGLFVTTFDRLSRRPLGFSHEHVLILETSSSQPQPAETWTQVADHLREMPGVQSAALAGWPLLSENRWTGNVRVAGHPVESQPAYFLDVSSRFFETMGISLLAGRDFRAGETSPLSRGQDHPSAGVGAVNEAFSRTYFNGENPVGKMIEVRQGKDLSAPMEIVGYVRDAAYGNLREPIRPTVYVPAAERKSGAFLVRTDGDPRALALTLRRQVTEARSGFRVRTIETQSDFVRWHMVRERLLATLSLFFAAIALTLSAIGLYGVLNYSVTQQRREIGIRMAIGATSADVLRRLTKGIAGMIVVGLCAGVAAGVAGGRLVESLLFEVRATGLEALVPPIFTLLGTAVLAALPPAIRAVRIDPAQTLRAE